MSTVSRPPRPPPSSPTLTPISSRAPADLPSVWWGCSGNGTRDLSHPEQESCHQANQPNITRRVAYRCLRHLKGTGEGVSACRMRRAENLRGHQRVSQAFLATHDQLVLPRVANQVEGSPRPSTRPPLHVFSLHPGVWPPINRQQPRTSRQICVDNVQAHSKTRADEADSFK